MNRVATKRLVLTACLSFVVLMMPCRATAIDLGVGAGVRMWLNDSPAIVVGMRIVVARIDDISITLQPMILYSGNLELRAAITLGVPLSDGLRGYAGAGVAYNESGYARIDPMLFGAATLAIAEHFAADTSLGILIKPGDTDTEFTASLWYLAPDFLSAP